MMKFKVEFEIELTDDQIAQVNESWDSEEEEFEGSPGEVTEVTEVTAEALTQQIFDEICCGTIIGEPRVSEVV